MTLNVIFLALTVS